MKKYLPIIGLIYFNLIFLPFNLSAADELIVITPGISPISYLEKGKFKGIGNDIVVEAFKRLDLAIKIQIYPSARALKMLESGQADALFALAKTPEREIYASYTKEPIIKQPLALYVLKDSKINYDGNVESIRQYKIGILRGGRFSPDFAEAIKNRFFPKLDEANDYSSNILKLEKHRIDIVVGPRLSVLFAAKEVGQQNNLKELKPTLAAETSAYIAFSKKGKASNFTSDFDKILEEMHKDGSYNRILDSYLK